MKSVFNSKPFTVLYYVQFMTHRPTVLLLCYACTAARDSLLACFCFHLLAFDKYAKLD